MVPLVSHGAAACLPLEADKQSSGDALLAVYCASFVGVPPEVPQQAVTLGMGSLTEAPLDPLAIYSADSQMVVPLVWGDALTLLRVAGPWVCPTK